MSSSISDVVISNAQTFANYLKDPTKLGRTIAKTLSYPSNVKHGYNLERAHRRLLQKMYAHEAGTHKLRLLRLDGLSDIEASWVHSMPDQQRAIVARALTELDLVRGHFQTMMLRMVYNRDVARLHVDDVLEISNGDRNLRTAALLAAEKLVEVEGASNLVNECLSTAGIRCATCRVYAPYESYDDLLGRDLTAALRDVKPCNNPEAQLLDKPLACCDPAKRPYNFICTEDHILHIERNEEGHIALLMCHLSSGRVSGNDLGRQILLERRGEAAPNYGLLLMQCARMMTYENGVQNGMVALLLVIGMEPRTWIHVGRPGELSMSTLKLVQRINHGSALSVFGHFRECESLMRNSVRNYYRQLSCYTGSPRFFNTLQEQQKLRGTVPDGQVERLSSEWSNVHVETNVTGEEDLPFLMEGTGAIAEAEALLLAAGTQAVREAAAKYKKISISKLTSGDARRSMSGSLWLDRVVKGELMTRARVSARLKGSIREDRPRVYETLKDEGIYMPLYQTMLVYPKMDKYFNFAYESKQMGGTKTYAELGGALVCLSLLLDDVDDPAIALEILKLDAQGSEGLTKPCQGRLAELIYGAAKSREDKNKVSVSQLYDLVYQQSSDALDKDWIVREMVSVLASLNVCHTYVSRKRACYSVALERKYHRERQRVALLEYDRGIQMAGTPCKEVRVIESGKIAERFFLLDWVDEEAVVLRCSRPAVMVIENGEKRYHNQLGVLSSSEPSKADIAPGHIEVIHLEEGMKVQTTNMSCYWVSAASMEFVRDSKAFIHRFRWTTQGKASVTVTTV